MDGIFVGQGVGSTALGTVNIGVPFITFSVAIVAMFPMGGATIIAIRIDGSPTLSFVGMCAGAVSNIFLDWLFIFPLQMGVIGAAVASGLGQIVSLLVLLSHFIHKHGNLRIRRFTIQPVLIRKICKHGAPEAVTQLTTPVTALCYNLALSGVAQGLQPLWGNSYGKIIESAENLYFKRSLYILGNWIVSKCSFTYQ